MNSELEGALSDDEEYDPYSMMPVTKLVALYDYSYQDDDGNLVHMKEGEQYHLIQKEGDWWEVVRDMGDSDDLSFYVPANYVRVVDKSGGSGVNSSTTTATRADESCVRDNEENRPGNRTLFEDSSDLSSEQVTPEKNVDKTENGVQGLVDKMAEDSINNELRFERKPSTTFSTFGNTSGSLTLNTRAADTKGLRRSFSDEGDYVNLDQYRQDIGIPSDRNHDDGEEVYANLQQLHGQDGGGFPPPPDTPPPATQGIYLKTLLDVWDKYLDPAQKREFYVNKETQERTYKPPRPADKQKQVVTVHASPYSHVQEHYVQRPVMTVEALNSRKVSLPEIQVQAPTGWRIEDSAAGKIFVSCATNEKESTSNDQRSATLAPHIQEGLSATMKVAKVMEAGKPKKKNYNQNYVKLAGSNIVFYKDLRASKSQPGSPNGRPEFIVPLHGASVERHGKEKTKRNIKLSTNQGDQYVLQYEDEIMLQNWVLQIDKTIRSLGGNPEPPSPSALTLEPPSEKPIKKKPSFKTSAAKDSVVRKGSSNEEGSLERGKLRTKLFNFMKSRPTKESLEQKGIIKDAVFGAHLKQLCEREKGKIPKFIQKCVVAIEKKGLDHDGIYRISGNLAQIQKLRCQVDQDAELNLNSETHKDHYNLEDECWDVHVLSGSLKLFFRELKEPLFTFNLFDRFIPALSKEKNSDRLKAARELIKTLPNYNYETLKFLLAHLCKVIDHSKENRMQVHNVAIVFGPTLIWPETVTPNLAANMIYQSRIVEYCLLEYKNIFSCNGNNDY
eukprot:XP_019927406.1 PREDICTED: rho GTPase-activating protein 12 isoform X8 [Crassostrea gigas]